MIFKKKPYYDTPDLSQSIPSYGPTPTADTTPDPVPQESSPKVEDKEESKLQEADLTASISRNTIIKGDIVTKDNLEIFGCVQGNVSSEAIVKVFGEVRGKIICGTFVASGAIITGDITCKDSLVVREKTEIEGDITCFSASISGIIAGNITAQDMISLSETAEITGDVTGSEIEVSKGAVLRGAVSIQKKEIPAAPTKPQITSKTKAKPEPKEQLESQSDPAPAAESSEEKSADVSASN